MGRGKTFFTKNVLVRETDNRSQIRNQVERNGSKLEKKIAL